MFMLVVTSFPKVAAYMLLLGVFVVGKKRGCCCTLSKGRLGLFGRVKRRLVALGRAVVFGCL